MTTDRRPPPAQTDPIDVPAGARAMALPRDFVHIAASSGLTVTVAREAGRRLLVIADGDTWHDMRLLCRAILQTPDAHEGHRDAARAALAILDSYGAGDFARGRA